MKNKALIIIGTLLAAIIIIAVAIYPELSQKATEDLGETTVTGEENSQATEESTFAVSYQKYADITFFDENSNAVKLSDFEGKPIIINFWATWCGYCLYEMPDFEAAFREYGDEVQFLIINSNDGITKAKQYLDSKGYTFPAYYDLEYSAYITYGLSSLPRTVAIDADGNMVYNRAGMITAEILQSIIDTVK